MVDVDLFILGKPKVTFWTLKTLASDDFDLSRLTERQQLAFFAAQSKKDGNILKVSPFRLDRLLAESAARCESPLKRQSSPILENAAPMPPDIINELTEEALDVRDSSILTENSDLPDIFDERTLFSDIAQEAEPLSVVGSWKGKLGRYLSHLQQIRDIKEELFSAHH